MNICFFLFPSLFHVLYRYSFSIVIMKMSILKNNNSKSAYSLLFRSLIRIFALKHQDKRRQTPLKKWQQAIIASRHSIFIRGEWIIGLYRQ